MELAVYRPETTTLPKQPLIDLCAVALVCRIKLAKLAAETLQDGAGTKDQDRLSTTLSGRGWPFKVDNGRIRLLGAIIQE